MGFTDIKSCIIKCLESGDYDHETRTSIDVKNLLACGQISEAEVIRLINKTRGTEYEKSPHHYDRSVMVHIFKPKDNGMTWYIKFYFVEPSAMFISVHL